MNKLVPKGCSSLNLRQYTTSYSIKTDQICSNSYTFLTAFWQKKTSGFKAEGLA